MLAILGIAACFYMLYRTHIVHKESVRLIEQIYQHKLACIEIGVKPTYDYNDVEGYDKMLWQLFTFHWELKEQEDERIRKVKG